MPRPRERGDNSKGNMASTTALWISIEAAFAELEQLCIEARAAELAVEARQNEAELRRSMAAGRVGAVAATVVEQDPRQVRAGDLARDLAFREAHAKGADLVELRSRVRKRLSWLKGKLGEALTEHEVYHTLFPLVVYADELALSITRGQSGRWEPLQSELYEVDNGGELFFTLIEDHLRKDETHPIVFEVFYFCLKDGFVGMYEGDPRKLEEIRARVAARIPLAPTGAEVDRRGPAQVELVPFPWRYYAIGVASVAIGWLLLAWLGSVS